MSASNNCNDGGGGGGGGGGDLVDVTDLFRRCASECLSHSRPFTPIAAGNGGDYDGLIMPAEDDNDGGAAAAGDLDVTDGTLLRDLRVRGTSVDGSNSKGAAANNSEVMELAPLDLQDAMTALELGDKRMDCCEIPYGASRPPNASGEGDASIVDGAGKVTQSSNGEAALTFPPRVAPTRLSDGTPMLATLKRSSPSSPAAERSNPNGVTLSLPTSPCPSLLPHWNCLRVTPSLTSLLVLQLTALEAYIGTENGGSTAAETLYCMLWFHDGVLVDMSDRLQTAEGTAGKGNVDDDTELREIEDGVASASVNGDGAPAEPKGGLDPDPDELTVAQWILYASSLGTIRISEAVRWAVINADIYEEEDFGVALHGPKSDVLDDAQTRDSGEHGGEIDGSTSDEHAKHESKHGKGCATMRFCPKLSGSEYVELVWDTALSYLRLYKASMIDMEENIDRDNANSDLYSSLDALETILMLQQSFFRAIKILSNLNDETVCDFTKIAVKRSRETVELFTKLSENKIILDICEGGLIGRDGQLLTPTHFAPEEASMHYNLLSASFDPFVNRRLLGNAPVRKASFCNCPQGVISSLSSIASELEWGVCDLILHGCTLGRITRMLESNSLRGCGGAVPLLQKKTGPAGDLEGSPMGMNILSRSLVLLNLYFDNKLFGQFDFAQMIGQHMRQQCAVPDLLLEGHSASGVPWLTRLAKPMYDVLKALCLNRHRERAFTDTILLPAFQLLQCDAATVDQRFKEEYELDLKTTPSYATNYIILNTIRLMERYVGIGIELGLYTKNWYDLSTAIWYRDFLLSAMINVRGSMDQNKIERKQMHRRIKMEEDAAKTSKKGKGKKGKKSKQPASSPTDDSTSVLDAADLKPSQEDFEDRLEYTSLLLHRTMCRGLVRYIAALRQANLLRDPPTSITVFTTHQKRFEKRFEAFGMLSQPPHLSYEDYTRGSDFSAVKSEELLASATECFRSGKSVVDQLLSVMSSQEDISNTDKLYFPIQREEVLARAKVCVTNSLFLHQLASATSKGKTLDSSSVSIDFKAHKQYCTMTVK